jgi:hypothetical protein
MRLLLNRYDHDDKQTIGQLFLLGENDKIIAKWDSLELPWLDNQRRISCIPLGTYKARKHKSHKFGRTLWLQDVPNRSEILIHSGNYHTQILGCILIGKDLKDINKDGYLDVTRSRVAMKELMDSLHDVDGIMLEIVNSN